MWLAPRRGKSFCLVDETFGTDQPPTPPSPRFLFCSSSRHGVYPESGFNRPEREITLTLAAPGAAGPAVPAPALAGGTPTGLALAPGASGAAGIPIVLRYVLEFAANTDEAVAMLRRLPVHMSYSVALLDRVQDREQRKDRAGSREIRLNGAHR